MSSEREIVCRKEVEPRARVASGTEFTDFSIDSTLAAGKNTSRLVAPLRAYRNETARVVRPAMFGLPSDKLVGDGGDREI